MARSVSTILLIVLAGVLVGGCQQPNAFAADTNEPVAAPLGTISVYQLAGRLDMKVAASGAHSAALKDRTNTVLLFADPGGRVFVNGKVVGHTGGIVPVSGMLFLPVALTDSIRSALRSPRPKTPQRTPQMHTSARRLVVLDSGHGGKDPGTDKYRIYEKTINLSVARKVAQILRTKGVAVMLTRSDDTFIELNERAAIANRAGATLFVSIHADSSPDGSVHGFSAYVARSPSQQSVAAARAILRRLAGTTGAVDRGLKMADYRVLVRTTCPSVLVELGYLSNGFEAVKLADAGYQARLADAIAQGVSDFLPPRR